MAGRSAFSFLVLAFLLVPLAGFAQVSPTVVWQPVPPPLHFPEILFSIDPGKVTWWPPVGDGDELSDRGAIVARNAQLLRNFSPPLTFAPVDYGLDALQEMNWGPIAIAVRPVTFFSLNKGFQDAKRGWISDGDLLSDAGRIVARNKDLMANFHPMPPLEDMGLDAAFIPYFVPAPMTDVALPPEIWFSTVKGWFDEKLGRNIREGDLLSSRGHVVATNAQLLRNFQPDASASSGGVLPPVPPDYGLDAVYVPFYRPWYGTAVTSAVSPVTGVIAHPLPLEIWFSVKKGFHDKRGFDVSDGDLLSTTGRVVRTNYQLLEHFPNPTESPIQLNYGLDAVYVRCRKLILAKPVMDGALSKVADNKIELVFDGPVDVPGGAAVSVVAAGGQDVTSGFDVSVGTTTTAGDTLVLSERGGALADGGFYIIQPADALAVEPFVFEVGKLVGDANGDGAVDVVDLLSLVGSFGLGAGDAGYDPACDFNNDQSVDVADLLILVGNFGK
jgi:hypothetical protein